MARWVVLLRGVNVGRSARLSMADLRKALGDLGATDVVTHIQSGNAVFAHPGAGPALADDLRAALAADAGIDTRVLLRPGAALASAVAGNPFPEAVARPATLHVAFLSAAPGAEAIAAVDRARFHPDAFEVRGDLVYVHLPGGAARTKLTNDVWERAFGVTSTTRNWNTVTRLAVLAAD